MKQNEYKNRRVYLNGGLGNQLFGLAFGLNIGMSFECKVVLDTAALNVRGDQVSGLQLPKEIEVTNTGVVGQSLNRFATSRLKVCFPRNFYVENNLHFDSSLLTDKSKSRYFGYFQSWQYVEPVLEVMRTIISSTETSESYDALTDQYFKREFVAIHVRRGDYMNALNYHGIVERPYYESAIEKIRIEKGDFPVLVFSDDIEEARSIFPKADAYIGSAILESPIENLMAMSRASCFVGANSSLSWWSAAINPNSHSLKIFPTPWFTSPGLETHTLLAPSWNVMKRS